ncbi:hypothetical protein [Spongiactinospora sp. TRM90649]|uniref:hypothetical protein n=1 Tax=Spongiactinospora sp. TRM90649 TaxID=3031114 RepID=UPI0023F8AC5B|nr:hypothetical protein [Spongiactinospora sp. TRM90649]MDF5754811.1 hypothetical protein [Spongiactinospora sp. TRM90649]
MKSLLRTLITVGAAALVVLPAVSARADAMPHYKDPKVFGAKFQRDPGHDFSKKPHSRHNGVLRGWMTKVRDGVAEYEPIRWRYGNDGESGFVSPPKRDARVYASPIARDVRFKSAYLCKVSPEGPIAARRSLGTRSCSRELLIKRATAHSYHIPVLITVHNREIVEVREILLPHV